MSDLIGRREFLGRSCTAAFSGSTVLGSLLNLNLAGRLAADETGADDDYRALVCVFLAGGNDSFNMLVPRGEDEYAQYAGIRRNLSLPREDLLALEPGESGREMGLHPQMGKIRDLYNRQQLAFVANVGTLQQPVSKVDYESNPGRLPAGLFSHSDQQRQWHTSLPDHSAENGWLGRASELLQDLNGEQQFAASISLNGLNLMQTGAGTVPYVIGSTGSKGLTDWEEPSWPHGTAAVKSQLELEYSNLLQKTFVSRKKRAIELNKLFQEALENLPTAPVLGGDALGRQLRMVFRVIQARQNLSVRRQTFFVMLGGWDLHGSLIGAHDILLNQLNEALGDFQTALDGVGLGDKVTTYTASDFGRSLTSNGQGSDHGWGGNQLVMGGAVRGGQIYGTYPELYEGSPLDVGRGRLIPSISVDEYFGELACWLGVSPGQLPEVIPNIGRFYQGAGNDLPLGFMNS